MQENAIRASVRQFLLDNVLMSDAAQLDDDGSLLRRAILDSTGVIELVSFLEAHFEIAIDDAEIVPANLDTVNRIAAFVLGKRTQRQDSAA